MVSYSGSVYETLLEALVVRVKDKEASIRVQAVFAIAKLQNSNEWKEKSLVKYGEEGCEYEDEDEDTPTTILLKMMRYDPSA